MKLFKKKKEKSIELVIPPSVIPDQKENYINEIITPTLENQPAWWKKVRTQLYKGKNEHVSNLKYCPSFVDIFKYSYAITSPCDWYFESNGGDDWKFDTSNEHLIKTTKHDLVTQMMGFNSGKTGNIQLSISTNIRSSKDSGLIKLIFMQPMYHNPSMPLTIMPGVLPLIEETLTNININYSYDLNKPVKYMCKKGDVLALAYCTEKKLPKLNVVQNASYGGWVWIIDKFTGSYMDKLKKYYK
jgi:hypothetical protein|tara:strand:+ start:34 stop:762 length:729 start_codon:yes stop_codon:yes gene_type:complete